MVRNLCSVPVDAPLERNNKIEMIILLGWMPPQADDTTCP
jgi:hypothetical protein